MVSVCMFGVTSAGVQCQVDSSPGYGAALACFQPLADPAVMRGPVIDTHNSFGNITFENRWTKSLVAVTSGAARNTSSSASRSAVGDAFAQTTTSGLQWPSSVPAESGSHDPLSSYAGYIDPVSSVGTPTVGGASGSIAFIVGNPLGPLADATAASAGGYRLYRSRTNLYRRDLGLGSIGGGVDLGHLGSLGAASFASSGATFEGYVGDFTPFSGVAAFGAQGLLARGFSPLSK
jgi:hypothetical protein